MTLQERDVVRAKRYGNRSRQNYVIDAVLDNQPVEDAIAVIAHNEYSGQTGRYMLLQRAGLRVLRNYR